LSESAHGIFLESFHFVTHSLLLDTHLHYAAFTVGADNFTFSNWRHW